MKKMIFEVAALAAVALALIFALAGCRSTTDAMAASAGEKNVDLRGYVMLGEIETANSDTATPRGRMIIGDVSYRSRKVGIPATQKVPNAGSYRHTKKTTLFGTSEMTTEWDYTAASPDEAAIVAAALRDQADKDRAAAAGNADADPAPEAPGEAGEAEAASE